MSKSPGFWFFTGDWLKDPELRFCSIFARGLLVDLLCFCFESARQGYLSKPDGTARTNEEIVSAISGGTTEEKLQALKELESSGVLSRDENGVLFSRRIARLADLSKTRSKAGSKGGSKTQAKGKQIAKQNTGVSVSDSVSVSVSDNTHTHTTRNDVPKDVPERIKVAFDRWCDFRLAIDGRRPDPISSEANLMKLCRLGEDKAERDIEFSILKSAKTILDSDNDFEKIAAERRNGSGRPPEKKRKTVQEMLDKAFPDRHKQPGGTGDG